MQISFGRKIPITQCQVYDNQKKEFTKATCYAFDCKDKSDLDEIEQMGNEWRYLNETLFNMQRGYMNRDDDRMTSIVVYTLEKPNGEKLGLCTTEDKGRRIDVNYLETKQDGKHKFAGQTLLASIGTQILNNSKFLFVIRNAVGSAADFYDKICGFRDNPDNADFTMNREGIRKFIKQTEERTKAPILEIKA